MELWDRDELRSFNDGLRRELAAALETVQQQQQNVAVAYERLANERIRATSRDGLIEVTVNSAGIVTATTVASDAFGKTTPEKLGRSITEAAQRAARQADEAKKAALAPLQATAEELPDLPDLFPGAPSLRDLRDRLLPKEETPAPPAEPPADIPGPIGSRRHADDDDDDYGSSTSWLRPVR